MKIYKVMGVALSLCVIISSSLCAQQYDAQKTEIGEPLQQQAEREVVITPAVPRTAQTPSPAVVSQSAQETVSLGAAATDAGQPTRPRNFWQMTKDGTVKASRATWSGIKKGARWTWNGTKKGAFYMKEGCISVAEKTGMIRDSEVNAHEDIMNLANKTLVESQTKREIREDTLRREGALSDNPAMMTEK
jgi:hypothetical protein